MKIGVPVRQRQKVFKLGVISGPISPRFRHNKKTNIIICGINKFIEDTRMSFYATTIQNNSKNDTYETPSATLDMVLDLLDPEKHYIWEPFPGSGSSTVHMRNRGFQVTNGTDPDFFNQTVPVCVSSKANPGTPLTLVIVTNPPFSIKKEILVRIAELGVERVAFLLPAATMYTKYFHEYITTVGQEHFRLIVHTKRCSFLDPATGKTVLNKNGKQGSCSFDVAWFTMGLGDVLPYGINFNAS
jgi:hypothetical protein